MKATIASALVALSLFSGSVEAKKKTAEPLTYVITCGVGAQPALTYFGPVVYWELHNDNMPYLEIQVPGPHIVYHYLVGGETCSVRQTTPDDGSGGVNFRDNNA